jgi:predicted dehydrogenase
VISVGVAGLGYWGPNLVRNFHGSARTDLRWLCDIDAGRLQSVGARYTSVRQSTEFEEMLADDSLDAVAIATPVHTHAVLAAAALSAGKHVLVEKPMTDSVAEAERLVELAASVGRVLLVDHVFVYAPSVCRMAELTRSGATGDILFFDAVRINLGVISDDVSVLWDLGPHDLSIIDCLIEREPHTVVGIGTRGPAGGVDDVVYLHLEYDDGLLASLHLSRLAPVKVRHFLAVGTRGSMLYNDLDVAERLKIYDRAIDASTEPARIRDLLVSSRTSDVMAPRLEETEPLGNLVEHFADCIDRRASPATGGDQGLRIVRVLEAAQQSLACGGERVKI